jgi:fatty-acyl-CoA synthase/long-chain acyl-CoA synthetase
MDSDGYLTLTGRLKELIIRGGENISPAEIEACLLDHPEVAAVAVVGLPDDRLGEIVAAIVCAAMPAAPGLPDRLTAHCRDRLSPHKVPTSWHHIGELPTTATGKVQKFRLVELVSTGAVPALH